MKYSRILVVGPPGSGKSSFSEKLAQRISLPLHHLDDYYWQKGWKRMPADEWLDTLRALCQEPMWILDGNHAKTFKIRSKNADLVIILDYSPWLCIWRFCKRSVRRYFRLNENLPANIQNDHKYKPKLSIQWHILKLILSFRFTVKKIFLRELARIDCPVVLFKRGGQAEQFLGDING